MKSRFAHRSNTNLVKRIINQTVTSVDFYQKDVKISQRFGKNISDVITRDMELLRREEIQYKNSKRDWATIFCDIPIPFTFDSPGNQSYQTQIFIHKKIGFQALLNKIRILHVCMFLKLHASNPCKKSRSRSYLRNSVTIFGPFEQLMITS